MRNQVFTIHAEPNRLPGRDYEHPRRIPFGEDRQHNRLTFVLEDAHRLFEIGEYEYVVVKDWFGNVIAHWHK